MTSCEQSSTKRYHDDIRWRIVWLRLTSQYQTYRSIAHWLCIGFGTVVRTLKHFKETGDVSQCTSHTRRPQLHILDDYYEMFIIGLALECPTTHLQEFCEVIYRATRVKVSIPTVCRILSISKIK